MRPAVARVVGVGVGELGHQAVACDLREHGRARHGAAVLVALDLRDDYLADSKMLTERRREALYEPLQQWADAWAVGAATSAEIV